MNYPRILALALFLMFLPCFSAFAQTLGPVSSYDELLSMVASAQNGDTILLSGSISADAGAPLSTSASIRLRSEDGAIVRGLHLLDASITLSGIRLEDGLNIRGTSQVSLANGVTVSGADGCPALDFSGNGALIVERGCEIEGGASAAGISIHHDGGEFYGSIEGRVSGGGGSNGGAGMTVSPLKEGGAVMITGSIQGGSGTSVGGHALNLYDLSGNAFITVGGTLQGGDGAIGGDGIQLVSASDHVNVGISGQVKGGQGENYGGNALILMNTEDASSVHLSGHFAGGDAVGEDAQPGTSLHLVGDSAALRARIDNCILEDGKHLHPAPDPEPTPDVTALPGITDEPVHSIETIQPDETPEPNSPPSPEPSSEPDIQPSPEPTSTPGPEPSSEPGIQPSSEPDLTPSPEPTPTPQPESSPTPDLTPSPEPINPEKTEEITPGETGNE